MSPEDRSAFQAARKRRNVAIALALVAFVVLVFLVTVAQLQGDILQERPL